MDGAEVIDLIGGSWQAGQVPDRFVLSEGLEGLFGLLVATLAGGS